jgi:hypothetical protein
MGAGAPVRWDSLWLAVQYSTRHRANSRADEAKGRDMEEDSDTTVHTHTTYMYSTYAAGKRSTRWQDSGSLPSPGSADLLLCALITHRSRHSSPLPGRAVRRPSPCPFPAPLPTPTTPSPGRTVSISDRLAQAQVESHSLRPRGKRTVQDVLYRTRDA